VEEPARIAPLVYYALWTALSRYDLEYFRELKDKCRLTLQAVERTKDVSELSAIPVSELRDDLLESEFYGDTVRFAGEVAFDDIAQELSRVKLHPRQRSLRDALSFLGSLLPQTQFQIEKVGRGHIFHCRNSAFVRSGCVRATCGFISGFVSAWMTWSGHSRARAEESVCMSLAPEARFCVFELK
jgi:hypothetical protein